MSHGKLLKLDDCFYSHDIRRDFLNHFIYIMSQICPGRSRMSNKIVTFLFENTLKIIMLEIQKTMIYLTTIKKITRNIRHQILGKL